VRVRREGELRGAVQGVGLRPFLARLARDLRLCGEVRNEGDCVRIAIEGERAAVDDFVSRMAREGPAAARLDALAFREMTPTGAVAFEIAASSPEGPRALTIGPDRRICAACAAEVRDPRERRHRHPFASCTACGPRFTIAEDLPFDRERTTMRRFEPCADCRREHDALVDRRAHAQTLACPACGPTLALRDREGATIAAREDALGRAVEALRRGAIVALLGLGGYQLLCDARDEGAIERLRARKRRPRQPFAVLVRDLSMARELAWLEADEARLLDAPSGPIVLVRARPGALGRGVAPGLVRVGLLLPTTPLHALVSTDVARPLVCTSGNAHDDPIVIDPAQAHAALGSIADVFLEHDRPVAHRADDSVVHHVAGRARVLRAGRGLAPGTIRLGGDGTPTLAVGAQWRNAPVLVTGEDAVLLPHLGDLEGPLARAAFEEAIVSMQALLRVRPARVACDAHPDHVPTIWAEARARGEGLALVRVHHHHAHVASVLAEHGVDGALGFAWDGTGLAPAPGTAGGGRVAGGELLEVGGDGARWLAHVRTFALPGGDAAARDARRALASVLRECGLPVPEKLARFAELAAVPRISPRTSSVGRLLDAAACALGVCETQSYEGQAPSELEALADVREQGRYRFELADDGTVDWRPTLRALFADRADPPRASARLHETLVAMVVAQVEHARAHGACGPRVVLSGGCFANRRLLEGALAALSERGHEVLASERVPAGDGGIALGQAWVASRAPRGSLAR
jgi:hydrogenase maturation protein HypF